MTGFGPRILALPVLAVVLGGCAQAGRTALPAPVAPFPAAALVVEAGDTLVLRHARTQRVERLRLEGIDAPEIDQPHGWAAARALQGMVGGASLVVSATGRDTDGSLLGWLCLADEPYFTRWSYPACRPGESVNHALAEAGEAWAVPASDSSVVAAQSRARLARSGLWADVAPIAPWQWRRLDERRRGAILIAASPRGHAPGPVASHAGAAPAGEAAAVDYRWLFGVGSAPAPAGPVVRESARHDLEELLRVLF